MKRKGLFFIALSVIVCFTAAYMFALKKGDGMSEKKQNELIPRQVLFGNPDKTALKLSPDGKHISYLAPLDGVLNVFVADIHDINSAVPITKDTKRGIRVYFWAYDNKHVIYLQDKNGDENWHVHLVDIATKEDRNLTPFEGVRAQISAVSKKIPNEIIISLNKRDPKYFDEYKLNLESGKLDLLFENILEYSDIIIDDDYTLRFAHKMTKEGGKEILKFNKDLSTEQFFYVKPEDLYTTGIIGFNKDADAIYLQDSRGRDTAALVIQDLKTGEQKEIFHSDKADLSDTIMHPTEKTVQAVAYTYERSKWTFFDPKVEEDFKYLSSLNSGEVTITSRTLADDKWIIGYLQDDKPFSYYLYDRVKKTSEFLFSNRKDLEKYTLAPMHPVVIKSRDGLDMVSYLTLPVNEAGSDGSITPAHPVPLILDVHGGPTARDEWGLNPMHQWFANRGYAVLSVNYRGSTGFGKKFIELGNGEWAGKARTDLIDAVNWAIDNKIAIKDKVCIFGGSYGGYAVLAGLTFTPDVFACGVDIVGPSNIITLLDSIPPYWEAFRYSLIKKVGGDPSTEEGRKFLELQSPLTFHDRITKPLLIGHGANDPRVKQAEADQIVSAMKSKNIPVTYVLYPDEGHGFARPENRMSFYAITEQFLAKCLGGRFEPIGDAFSGSSLQIVEGKDLIVN